MCLQDRLLEKNKENGTLGKELKNYDFRYVLFTDQFKQYFSEHHIKVIAIAEFISYFQHNSPFGELEKVIFDGELRTSEINLLEHIISPLTKPIISSLPKADQLIPLVNKADRAARLLFRYYSKHPGLKTNRYEKYLLRPNLFLYAKLINS